MNKINQLVFWNLIELILHDAAYTKGITYRCAPLLHKETTDKKHNKNESSVMTQGKAHIMLSLVVHSK